MKVIPVFLGIIIGLSCLLAGEFALALDQCRIPAGQTYRIDEWGTCRNVKNNNGNDVNVPTKTSGEWNSGGNSFLGASPPGMAMSSCACGESGSCVGSSGGCAGSCVGGYCWYYGGDGQSCDTVCSGHGGCNLSGTKDYAGSGGTNQHCADVLYALRGQTYSIALGTHTLGCTISGSNTASRGLSPYTTTCAASYGASNRACACNN